MPSILTLMYGQLLSRFRHRQAVFYGETITSTGLHPVVSDDGFEMLLKEIDCFSQSFGKMKQSSFQK